MEIITDYFGQSSLQEDQDRITIAGSARLHSQLNFEKSDNPRNEKLKLKILKVENGNSKSHIPLKLKNKVNKWKAAQYNQTYN